MNNYIAAMTRSRFIHTLCLLLPAVTLFAAEARPPNLLHIHADDHRADGLHAFGNDLLKMERYGDTAPLKVANPAPAAWTPPGVATKSKSKKAKAAKK